MKHALQLRVTGITLAVPMNISCGTPCSSWEAQQDIYLGTASVFLHSDVDGNSNLQEGVVQQAATALAV